MNQRERSFIKSFQTEFAESFQNYCGSMQIQAYSKSKKVMDFSRGEVYAKYDLASLTKVIFTTTACLAAFESDKKFLTKTFLSSNKKKYKVSQLLNHTAGYTWWEPLYEKLALSINDNMSWQEKRQVLRPYIDQQKLQTTKKAVYSDLDFLRLGFVLEEFFQQSLPEIWRGLQERFDLPGIEFHLNNKPTLEKSAYAPTFSHQWQPKPLQGVVNDANTRFLGGVSSHSGLFGGIDDVSSWFLQLRKSLLTPKKGVFSSNTVKPFMQRSIKRTQGDFALGFMMPSQKNASCGRHFSKSSIGHLGYTGTSLWWDPKKDLLVVILANRVIPVSTEFPFLHMLSFIHDSLYEIC